MRCIGVVAFLLACSTSPSLMPRALPPPPANVKRPPASIAVGETWGCARTSADVRCWGYQVPGLPLEPSTRSKAERIPELDGAIAIVGNRAQLCALMPEATARCASIEHVPNGKHDVHGHPFHDARPVVKSIDGVNNAVQLAVGAAHACALLRDGTVQCWGRNTRGELGDGTREPRNTPVVVRGVTSAVEIASGMASTCVRLTDGSVQCWGGEDPSLRTIDGVRDAAQIACGWSHACARLTDGSVRCWGSNNSGQLGDGTRENRRSAVAVRGLANVAGIALGDNHTCARLVDGSLACWGDNTYGEVGPTTNGDSVRADRSGSSTFRWKERYVPATVVGLTDVVDIALGSYLSCARTRDGSAYCFGRNDLGQIGPRDLRERPTPFRIELD